MTKVGKVKAVLSMQIPIIDLNKILINQPIDEQNKSMISLTLPNSGSFSEGSMSSK